jgi:hypothetical protein
MEATSRLKVTGSAAQQIAQANNATAKRMFYSFPRE